MLELIDKGFLITTYKANDFFIRTSDNLWCYNVDVMTTDLHLNQFGLKFTICRTESKRKIKCFYVSGNYIRAFKTFTNKRQVVDYLEELTGEKVEDWQALESIIDELAKIAAMQYGL